MKHAMRKPVKGNKNYITNEQVTESTQVETIHSQTMYK